MDKFEFYLNKIETKFPKKSKLNSRQYCEIKGICSSTFNYITQLSHIKPNSF